MATDLSSLIQDSLSGTLESLLAKKSTLKEVTKAVPNEFKHEDKFVRVNTTFSFEQLTTKISFFVPALNASTILNMMMGVDTEPTNEINDDILDAINEVVSNICGGLTTSINGSKFADLTQSKFSVDGNSSANADEIKEEPNLFKLIVAQDDDELVVYISFEENLLPFIETIANSDETIHDNIEEIELDTEKTKLDIEETPPEFHEEDDNNSSEEILEDNENTPEIVNTPEEDTQQEETPSKIKRILNKFKFPRTNEFMVDEERKQIKLKQLIYIISIIFITIIVTFGVLIAIGVFDQEAVIDKKDINATATQALEKHTEIVIQAHPKPKQINFSITQINPKRLNKKLMLLTKFEIIENDKIEKQKLLEKEKFLTEKKKRLEEFASKNKEESLNNKDKITSANNKINKDLKSFVEIPTLQIQLYKDFIKDAKAIQSNLSICKDSTGRTHIYIGPFLSKENRDMLFKTLKSDLQKDSKKLDISIDGFNQKCKF